jgi:hypothetical protein
MAQILIGYRHDDPFMRLHAHLRMERERDEAWRVSWRSGIISLRGLGMAMDGQAVSRNSKEGIVVAVLNRGVSALRGAQALAGNAMNSILVASANEDQKRALFAAGLLNGANGYAIIRGEPIPGLPELSNAALIWGAERRIKGTQLIDELAWSIMRAFFLPDLPLVRERKPENAPSVRVEVTGPIHPQFLPG